jgi:DNA-binding CsgD family transcriptional regulator
MFLGREREKRVIRDLVAGIAQRGGALVVIGDPGIGKSTLADLARQFAIRQGLTVLATTGVPAESRLPYAGLHQLLRPLRDGIDDLPQPQRDALLSAFGLGTDRVPDRFLVALAVTDLLTAVAARQPLLVLADDAHWIDPPSCDVIAFLGRRVDSAPIVLLTTARDGYSLPLLEAGFPELRLEGLGEEAAGQLLDAIAPGLSTAARGEILDVSLGNPLALYELSRHALHADLATARVPASLTAAPVTYRIEKAFAARWSELPKQTRTVLLIAALNEGGTLGETLDAASLVCGAAVTTGAVTPAITARLVDAGPAGLWFRHPLVRSAIEYRAGLEKITSAHQALASVLAADPDRRAWHRASATTGPDESVAAELDEAASRAERRAAISVAITALERAVELSVDPAARNSRLLRAAQLAWELGRPALVDRFAGFVDRAGLDLADRARLALLQENIRIDRTEGAERIRYLVELTRKIAADGQADLAMDLLMSAARRCWQGTPSLEIRSLISEAALELTADPLHPVLLSVLAYATPDIHGPLVRSRLARLAGETSRDPGQLIQLIHLGQAATVLGAFEQSRALLAAVIPQLRAQGRLGLLVRALYNDAASAIYTGQWPEAIAAYEECQRIAAETGQHQRVALVKSCSAVVAAMRGEDAEAERLAGEAEQVLVTGSTAAALGRGLAALGRRDYDEAYQHLMRMYDAADGAFHYLMRMYHLGDLADAAAHSGHREQARDLIAELTASATGEPGPLLAVSLTFATVMLALDEDPGQLFEQALAGDLRQWPFYHARLRLEYGSWLRRHRQATQSRRHLRTARDILDAIGARAWRDRADAELRASGIRPRAENPQAGRFQQLTPQEQQIARMVLAGLSNRAIGERLQVSHRTVGYHLYRMFPKLGITSRAELGVVVAEAGMLVNAEG